MFRGQIEAVDEMLGKALLETMAIDFSMEGYDEASGLSELFSHFGNREILNKSNNVALLTSLRAQADCDIKEVIAIIDQHACVLEQEALLVGRIAGN